MLGNRLSPVPSMAVPSMAVPSVLANLHQLDQQKETIPVTTAWMMIMLITREHQFSALTVSKSSATGSTNRNDSNNSMKDDDNAEKESQSSDDSVIDIAALKELKFEELERELERVKELYTLQPSSAPSHSVPSSTQSNSKSNSVPASVQSNSNQSSALPSSTQSNPHQSNSVPSSTQSNSLPGSPAVPLKSSEKTHSKKAMHHSSPPSLNTSRSYATPANQNLPHHVTFRDTEADSSHPTADVLGRTAQSLDRRTNNDAIDNDNTSIDNDDTSIDNDDAIIDHGEELLRNNFESLMQMMEEQGYMSKQQHLEAVETLREEFIEQSAVYELKVYKFILNEAQVLI
jgi:hypothetical protein